MWFLSSPPERKTPFRYSLSNQKIQKGLGPGFGQKTSFLKTLTKRFLIGKEIIRNIVFQVSCEFQITTNIASWSNKVFLSVSVTCDFWVHHQKEKHLSGIHTPTKRSKKGLGPGFGQKTSFLKTLTKRFLIGKKIIQNIVFQVSCEFQITTNIAPWLNKVFLSVSVTCDFWVHHQKEKHLSDIHSPTKRSKRGWGLDLDKKHHFWRLLQKDF